MAPEPTSPLDPPEPLPEAFSEGIREAALRLLSVRSRTVRELRTRLLEKGLDGTGVESCIHWLIQRGFLDDGSFARAYVLDRIRFSPRSPFLLLRELKDRGVEEATARASMDAALEEEDLTPVALAVQAAEGWVRKQPRARARALLGPRFGSHRERARRSLYGFLARRGFVGDAARQGLEAAEEAARAMLAGEGPRGP